MLANKESILVYRDAVDMRKSFNGLIALTRNVLHEDPLSDKLFVFYGKSGKVIKVLYWDRTGFVIYAKKLEVGKFKIYSENLKTPIKIGQLLQILDGIPLGIKQKIR